jgi:hypothetical protein
MLSDGLGSAGSQHTADTRRLGRSSLQAAGFAGLAHGKQRVISILDSHLVFSLLAGWQDDKDNRVQRSSTWSSRSPIRCREYRGWRDASAHSRDLERTLIGVVTAALTLVGAVMMWLRGTSAWFSQIEELVWIPSLGAAYRVGVDGISLPFVALTTVLFLVSLVFSVKIADRARSYVALFLMLETACVSPPHLSGGHRRNTHVRGALYRVRDQDPGISVPYLATRRTRRGSNRRQRGAGRCASQARDIRARALCALQMTPEAFRSAALVVELAVFSAIYGALAALAQTDLKRLVAYTSVNHMAYVMLGVAAALLLLVGMI